MALIAALVTVIPNVVAPTMLSKAHADQIAVRWDKNGGTVDAVGGSSTTSHLGFRFYGWENQFLVFPTPPTWEGHTFIGWFAHPVHDESDCSIAVSGSCDPLVIQDGTLVFFAHWFDNHPQITWDGNGVTVNTAGASITTDFDGRDYGQENDLEFPTPPTWEGHTFIGWFAKPVADQENCGIGSQGSCNSLEIRDGKLVFYARWSNSDSRLSALTLSSGTLSQPFASDIYSYAATVTNSVSSISITPTFIQANSTSVQHLLLEDETWDFDGSLSVGPNVVETIVTSEDHRTTKTYTVTVTRLADATLLDLYIIGGSLSPTFDRDTSNYRTTVTKATSSTTVTATVHEADATIQVNGTPVNSGSRSSDILLEIGVNNVIRIVVTNKDGTTTKTYTVTVTRQTDDATLKDLTLSSGTLTPMFASATRTGYTASVSDSSITITPTVNQVNATTVQYLGADGTTPFTGALSLGSNVIRTVVTALNGSTRLTYTVTVTRVNPPNYNISWDNQGADVRVSSGGSSNFTTGSAVATIPTTAPQKTGYTFVGWFTGATSGTQVTNGSYTPASPYGNLTFYAKWAVDEASVKAATDAVAKAAADAAAAQREAEKQSARADVTAKLQNAKDLTPETFAKAEIPGVTTKNIAAVLTELMAMPENIRTDINQILKVAHKYEVVGNIGSDQIKNMLPNSFVEIGLIPAESKNKVALVAAIRKLPEASRDTYVEIKAAIDAATKEIQVRSDRLAAIIARNATRYKK